MNLKKIEGLKYPDPYVTRFFFKRGLDKNPGYVLELGCGYGNNLMLFAEYRWGLTGIDIDSKRIEIASRNLDVVAPNHSADLRVQDLSNGLGKTHIVGIAKFTAVLMANMLNYLDREEIERLFGQVREHMMPGAHFMLRTRGVADYRFGRGRRIAPNGFRLDTAETGEANDICYFYQEHELADMCRYDLGIDPDTMRVMTVNFQNEQGEIITSNQDIVVWGRARQ